MMNKKFSGLFALILSICLAFTTFSFLGAKADGGSESPQHFLPNGVQGDGPCLGKASVHGLAKLLLVGSKMGF